MGLQTVRVFLIVDILAKNNTALNGCWLSLLSFIFDII